MRKYLLVSFVIALMLVVAIPSVLAEDQTSNANLTITGQISHGSEPQVSPNVIEISINEMDDGEKIGKFNNSCKTNLSEDGSFSIDIKEYNKGKDYCITIMETGYMVYIYPENTMKRVEGTMHTFLILLDDYEGRDFSLTSTDHYIAMHGSKGSVTGKIQSSSGSKPYLNGVTVTLKNKENNNVYTEQTSGSGEYTFNNYVEIGTYKLTVEGKGFEDYEYEDDIIVEPEQIFKVKTIEMNPTNEISTAHIMTYVGLACALAFLACVIFYTIRHRKS